MPSALNRSEAQDEYQIAPLHHSEVTEPIRVICVGSGISGLCLAYKMMKSIPLFELTIYEKNKDIGGTLVLTLSSDVCQKTDYTSWFENRYPGCACDIPAHLYSMQTHFLIPWRAFTFVFMGMNSNQYQISVLVGAQA
jgi:cation diffusion facilitator CzcD-associated flavoprotein CzcO